MPDKHPISSSGIKRNCVDSFNNDLMQRLKGYETGKKLRTYKDFKSMVNFESYLDILKNQKQRKIYSKFRLSSHDLEIERLR